MSAPKHDPQKNLFASVVRGAQECGRSLLSQRFETAEKIQETRKFARVSKSALEDRENEFSATQRAFR